MALDVLVADVSGWQSEDVSSLARDGFKAVIPKYTEDLSSASGAKAHGQCRSARAAGMTVFAGYDFGLGSDGSDQCDALLNAFGGDEIQRVVLDAEVASVSLDIVLDFGRRAKEWNSNVKPILYASTSFIQEMYGNSGEVADLFDAWIAAYTRGYDIITWPGTPTPGAPRPFQQVIGWQFTSQFPSSIGLIDASVFDSTVFVVDKKEAEAKYRKACDMVIYHNVDMKDPDVNTADGEWVAMEGSHGPTKITQVTAFLHAINGVPWLDDMHALNIVALGVTGAQARRDSAVWDKLLEEAEAKKK